MAKNKTRERHSALTELRAVLEDIRFDQKASRESIARLESRCTALDRELAEWKAKALLASIKPHTTGDNDIVDEYIKIRQALRAKPHAVENIS
jgi:hypothetical protein